MDPSLTTQPNVLDQNCESRQTLDRVADKWSALVVYALVRGPRRHGQLKREIDGISQKMLTQTLRSMERDGLVTRRVVDRVPPHVEYELTPLGTTLTEPLVAICRWSMDHLPDVQRAQAAYDARPAAAAPGEEAAR
jgi:DNA-binding HxlR family transcriptional regulator